MGIVQRIGDLSFPVDATEVTDTLCPLDPARARLTALFKAAINAEFGDVWTTVTDTLSASHPLYGTSPVQDTLELDPSHKTMTERKCAFPLLCVYRTGEGAQEQHTLFIEKFTDKWGVDYFLGPLDVGDVRKLQDICNGIVKLISSVVRRRGHPAYESGALQFFPDLGGLAEVTVKSHVGPGQAKFAGDESGTVYYALSIILETVELLKDEDAEAGDFIATDYSVAVGSSEELVPDLIEAATDTPYQAG